MPRNSEPKRWGEEQLARCNNPELAGVIQRNIATIAAIRQKAQDAKTTQDRIADHITQFSGSMLFFYLHAAWFGAWIIVNLSLTKLTPFDPFPFGLLTLIVSLEAIFLSTFVLLSQNRQAATADERADMDLQIDLLAEYEITRLLILVDGIAKHLGLTDGKDPELSELEQEVDPDVLAKKLTQPCELDQPQRTPQE
jgi:uncharacterized membrane protein